MTNEINQLALENKDLRRLIEDYRKEKLGATTLYENLKNVNVNLEQKLTELEENNNNALKRKKKFSHK